jgi:hypothetical protein
MNTGAHLGIALIDAGDGSDQSFFPSNLYFLVLSLFQAIFPPDLLQYHITRMKREDVQTAALVQPSRNYVQSVVNRRGYPNERTPQANAQPLSLLVQPTPRVVKDHYIVRTPLVISAFTRLLYCSRNWMRPYVPNPTVAKNSTAHVTVTTAPIGGTRESSRWPGITKGAADWTAADASAAALGSTLVGPDACFAKTPFTKDASPPESVVSRS